MPPISDLIQGHKFQTGIAKQSAAGTPATVAEFAIPAYGGAMKPQESRTPFEVIDGNAYRPGQYKDKAWVGGTVTFQSFPDSLGRLVTAHMGSDTVTGTTNFTHTIVSNNAPQWLTLWTQRPLVGASTEWDKYEDCFMKSIELQYSAGQLFRVQCEVLGRLGTTTVTAPTITTTNILDSVGPYHTWAGATILLDLDATPAATALGNLQNFVIHMGYDGADVVQTQNLTADFRDIGLWTVTMSADFVMSDWAAFKATYFGSKTASNAAQSATVLAGALDFTIQTSPTVDANKIVQIKMPAVDFSLDAPDPDVSGKGLKTTLTGVLQKPTSGAPMTVLVKNLVSAAY